MKNKKKVLVLFSNGLDSRLALKIMKQFCDVEAIFFVLPFLPNKEKIVKEAKEFCKKERVKLKIVRCDRGKLLEEYLKIIRNPKYGRGKGMNPCIDCRIFVIKKALKYMKKIGAKAIVTGEVIGERPMSQTKKALKIIEKESNADGLILRPLSAKLLEKTKIEKERLDKNLFYNISGRSRKKQLELARKFKIDYPSPAGGCLLCDKIYCEKLKPFLKDAGEFEIELSRTGRHFNGGKIILGRNKKENKRLEKLFNKYKKGILVIPNKPAPTAWIKNRRFLNTAKNLIEKYSKHKGIKFKIKK